MLILQVFYSLIINIVCAIFQQKFRRGFGFLKLKTRLLITLQNLLITHSFFHRQ